MVRDEDGVMERIVVEHQATLSAMRVQIKKDLLTDPFIKRSMEKLPEEDRATLKTHLKEALIKEAVMLAATMTARKQAQGVMIPQEVGSMLVEETSKHLANDNPAPIRGETVVTPARITEAVSKAGSATEQELRGGSLGNGRGGNAR